MKQSNAQPEHFHQMPSVFLRECRLQNAIDFCQFIPEIRVSVHDALVPCMDKVFPFRSGASVGPCRGAPWKNA